MLNILHGCLSIDCEICEVHLNAPRGPSTTRTRTFRNSAAINDARLFIQIYSPNGVFVGLLFGVSLFVDSECCLDFWRFSQTPPGETESIISAARRASLSDDL